VRTQSTLRESGKIPETRELFGTEPGRTGGLRATPIAKSEDKKEIKSE